ncbi:hypothetical protein [Nibrella saemangeumensis]
MLSIVTDLQAQERGTGWSYKVTIPPSRRAADLYRVKITTLAGRRVVGYLYDLNNSQVLYTRDNPNKENLINVMVLDIRLARRVSLYPQSGWFAGPLEGAVIGGIGLGYLAFQSIQKSPPRSPVAYGLNLVLAVGGGAGLGAVAGSGIQQLTARPLFRSVVQEGKINELMEQLRPYSYRYQTEVIERIPE